MTITRWILWGATATMITLLVGCGDDKAALGSASKQGAGQKMGASRAAPAFVPDATILSKIDSLPFTGSGNDTHAGDGMSGEEVFELHKELRKLTQENIKQAPSERELELLNLILYGKPDRSVSPSHFVTKMNKKAGTDKAIVLFYDGYEINTLIEKYKATKNHDYLECAMVMADYLMADFDARKNRRVDFKQWAAGECWLGLGRGYGGIAEMIRVVALDPELHDLKVGRYNGQVEDYIHLTYLERCESWMKNLKKLIDFRKSNDRYDNGKWSETDKEIDYKGGPASTNRFLYYLHFLIATADAADALNSTTYGSWTQDLRKTVGEVFAYFERTFQKPDDLRAARRENMEWSEDDQSFVSEYGPYVVWAYKPERDNTEDWIHMLMDMEALDDIWAHDNTFFSEDIMKKIATTLMVCTYNYETEGIPFNLDPKDPGIDPAEQKPWHTFYAPKYGKYIGRYLPDDAYVKFMERQFKVWDEQLTAGKLGRFSQYSMPQEIIEARLFRYTDARFPKEP